MSEKRDSTLPASLRLYVPVMLASLTLVAATAMIPLAIFRAAWTLAIPAILVPVSGLHLLWLYVRSRKKIKGERDFFELKLPPEEKVKLREFVVDIARRWNTPRPDDIRLSGASAMHVYETRKGKRVLVIGGIALASLSQKALGAVVAHELSHLAAGDTADHWKNLAGFTTVCRLGETFRRNLAHLLDPAAWLVFGYQLYVESSLARRSRAAELRCDALATEHAGPEAVAAALIYLHAIEEMPWANTMDVLSVTAGVGAVSPDVFSEQARRAACAQREDWQDAIDDVMRQQTKPLDSHPCLAERLQAIGATVDDGLDFLLADDSVPARKLLKDWRSIERKLSVSIASAYQVWREYRYGWGGLTVSEPDD